MMKLVFALLLSSTAAMAQKVTCFQVDGPVTGQQFFECPQPDDPRYADYYKRQSDELAPGLIRPVLRIEKLPPPFPTPDWVPDEDTKAWALRRAYQLNGGSMVGGMIDLSNELANAKPVKTERILPTVDPKVKNEIDIAADVPLDICKRHGMHKVVIGTSWRCHK